MVSAATLPRVLFRFPLVSLNRALSPYLESISASVNYTRGSVIVTRIANQRNYIDLSRSMNSKINFLAGHSLFPLAMVCTGWEETFGLGCRKQILMKKRDQGTYRGPKLSLTLNFKVNTFFHLRLCSSPSRRFNLSKGIYSWFAT